MNASIKKEEFKGEHKLEQVLHDNVITKSESSKTMTTQQRAATIKSEDTNDNIKIPLSSKASKVTSEQITSLIGYIVNDRMSVEAASKKAGMYNKTAHKYYKEYKNDPEHKIPLPKTRIYKKTLKLTQAKIEELINYIVCDKMSISQAACKAQISRNTATKYYTNFMSDPERKTPVLSSNSLTGNSPKRYTQEQIYQVINYIIHDSMPVAAAARKANMGVDTVKRYYLKYLENPNFEIPVSSTPNPASGKVCKNDQVKSLIDYVVNQGMTVQQASIKTNMGESTASKYYRQYLEDPNHKVPTPQTIDICCSNKNKALDQIQKFFGYIINDKLNVRRASSKAKMSEDAAYYYYRKYLRSYTTEKQSINTSYTIEKMKKMVEYIQNEGLSVKSASIKANLNYKTAQKCYKQYLEDPEHRFPMEKNKHCTQEDIEKLISYIVNDNMSVNSAANKMEMGIETARKYYKAYQDDPEHKIPMADTIKQKSDDIYSKIIKDIYENKNNDFTDPIQEDHIFDLNLADANTTLESSEEDVTRFQQPQES